MPGKKKKNARPALGHPTDSLRADIAAAGQGNHNNPFASPPADEEEEDIAAQLLASLDARDEAEAQAQGRRPSNATPTAAPSTSNGSLAVPDGGKKHRASSSSSSGTSGGVFSQLKDAILHPTSSRSPHSPTPISQAAAAEDSGVASPSSGGSGHKLMSVFGGKEDGAGEKKIGRQKARKQRKEAEAQAERVRYEEELKANGGKPDEAAIERTGILQACDSLGVEMCEINPDGHCLYAAIADQSNLLGLTISGYPGGSGKGGVYDYRDMRKVTSEFMKRHRDDFVPFISDTDEQMAGIQNEEAGKTNGINQQKVQDHYLAYCEAIQTTAVWGGQPEILAQSRILSHPIWVIQAGQPIVKVGGDEGAEGHGADGQKIGVGKGEKRPILISYHRRMYGLGEHYNSLRPAGGGHHHGLGGLLR